MRKILCPVSDPTPLFRHGGAHPGYARRLDFRGGAGLDFSVSVNPLGPPPQFRDWLRHAAPGVGAAWRPARDLIASYPDPECRLLVERLAQLHGVGPAQVVVGNGSTELIHAVPRAFRPRRAAIAEPTFTEYLRACRRADAAVDHWLAEGEDFRLEPFDPEGAALIWLCNPNSPTGQLWQRDQVLAWISAQPRTLFVVDEAFLPFLADEAEQTLIPEVARLGNLIVLRSLTKIYALAGLRLGYAVTNSDHAARLRDQTLPWSVNQLAQLAGLEALKQDGFVRETRAWFQEEAPAFRQQLRACSACLEPLPSQANFVLLRLHGMTAGWLTGRLAERGIGVRDASNFVGLDRHYVRVALRTRQENAQLLNELRLLAREA